ncbi:hypothetical protein J6590_056714 [Homalodisca vitripennis]|nr:hypothetical protein J6590_056714 [Homalodisca vitripennis]
MVDYLPFVFLARVGCPDSREYGTRPLGCANAAKCGVPGQWLCCSLDLISPTRGSWDFFAGPPTKVMDRRAATLRSQKFGSWQKLL